MKIRKVILCLVLCVTLLCGVGMTAWATQTGDVAIPYVTDTVGMLSQEQVEAFESFAQQTAEEYGCGIYLIVVNDYRDYENTSDIYTAAMNIYERYGLGCGDGSNGVLLLMSMSERDYALATYGELTHRAFTDYGQDALCNSFLEYFRSNDWAGGFSAYFENSRWLLEQAENGTPYDVPADRPVSEGGSGILAVPIACIVALVICLIFKGQMKTAVSKTEANDYIGRNGVRMTITRDSFIRRSQVRQVIETDSHRSGGGGTSINSRGFSGRSGKF